MRQVDNDVYAASNLTRQCLGAKCDVGKRILGTGFHSVAAEGQALLGLVAIVMSLLRSGRFGFDVLGVEIF